MHERSSDGMGVEKHLVNVSLNARILTWTKEHTCSAPPSEIGLHCTIFPMYVLANNSTKLSANALAYCGLCNMPRISPDLSLILLCKSPTNELWSAQVSIFPHAILRISRQHGSRSTSTLRTKPRTAALAMPMKVSAWLCRSTESLKESSIRHFIFSSRALQVL